MTIQQILQNDLLKYLTTSNSNHPKYKDIRRANKVYFALFSALFWLGDLNYRIDAESAKIRNMIANGKHLELLCCDQVKFFFQASKFQPPFTTSLSFSSWKKFFNFQFLLYFTLAILQFSAEKDSEIFILKRCDWSISYQSLKVSIDRTLAEPWSLILFCELFIYVNSIFN